MAQENVEIVGQALDAFNSRDITRILALTHPDFEGEIPPEVSAEPDTYRGHDGIRRYFESFWYAMDEIHFEAERLSDIGQSVVVALRMTARGRHTAIPVEQRVAGVWIVNDGRVIRIRTYTSLSE